MTDLDHAQLALGKVGDLDLLDGNGLTGAPVETLVDGTEGTLADAVSESLAVDPDVSDPHVVPVSESAGLYREDGVPRT